MAVNPKINELQELCGVRGSFRPCVGCFTFSATFSDHRQFSFCNQCINICFRYFVFLKTPLLLLLADALSPICFLPWRTVVWSRFGHGVVLQWLRDVVICKPQAVVFHASMPPYPRLYSSCI